MDKEQELNTILELLEKSVSALDYALERLFRFIEKLPIETQEDIKKDLEKFFTHMEVSLRESKYYFKSNVPNNSKRFIV